MAKKDYVYMAPQWPVSGNNDECTVAELPVQSQPHQITQSVINRQIQDNEVQTREVETLYLDDGYNYLPSIGPLPGKSFERQTTDFFNRLQTGQDTNTEAILNTQEALSAAEAFVEQTVGDLRADFAVVEEKANTASSKATQAINAAAAAQQTANNSVQLTGNQTVAGVKTFTSDIVGNVTGNAGTATKLQTARTISLSGDASGSASFDGSGNITINATVMGGGDTSGCAHLTGDETIAGTKTFSSTIVGNISGNAGTATKLETARTINGTSFDGSADITTSKWGTARNISIADSDGTNTGTAVSVDGSAAKTLLLPSTIKASLTGNVTGNITGNVSGSSGSCTGNAATATTAKGVYFVVPNEMSQTATLTATVSGIDAYFAGLTIALEMSFATAADSTLNINSLGAVPIYYKVNTTGASYYPANTVILLVYETTTLSTGCFKMVYSYDSNTNNATAQNILTTNNTYPILLGATANATANIGNKATYFGSGIKANPSTSTIVATTFQGNLTGNVTGDCSGSSGSCTGNAATATTASGLASGYTVPVANGGTGSSTQNFVDLTTAQTVAGVKTLTGNPVVKTTGPTITMQQTDIDKGTNPTANQSGIIAFVDKDGTASANRTGAVINQIDKTTGLSHTGIFAYQFADAATANAALQVYCSADGNTKYAVAPTPAAGDNSTKIATTAWVNNLQELSSRTTSGSWSITGVIKNKPLYIVTYATDPPSDSIYATSGAWGSGPVSIFVPTATTVVLNVPTLASNTTLRAYQ